MKINPFLEKCNPCKEEVEHWLNIWGEPLAESSLQRLFTDLCPKNDNINDIFIKCVALNSLYSTQIFSIENVAKHYITIDIDSKLQKGDLSLVADLTPVKIGTKVRNLYSFASKYCSFHNPDKYPLYDRYVHLTLKYFSEHKEHFSKFSDNDLRDYPKFVKIIEQFQAKYHLEEFSAKQMDIYLWQIGKEAFKEER